MFDKLILTQINNKQNLNLIFSGVFQIVIIF